MPTPEAAVASASFPLDTGETVTVINTTVAGNFATTTGGGIYAEAATSDDDSIHVLNSTIARNFAVVVGFQGQIGQGQDATGGIASPDANKLRLDNTIVAENSGGSLVGPDAKPDVDATFVAGSSYNLVGIDRSLTNNIDSNDAYGNLVGGEPSANGVTARVIPRFVGAGTQYGPIVLSDYGGAIPTFALSELSPAIDRGDPNFSAEGLPASLAFDTRVQGFLRVVDGDAIAGERIDIGAFELQVEATQVASMSVTSGTVSVAAIGQSVLGSTAESSTVRGA